MANADAIRDDLTRLADSITGDIVNDMVNDLQAAAPFESGETRDSIEARQLDYGPVFSYEILSPTPQSVWTEEGTDPHVIEGNPLLAFNWPKLGGKLMILRSVNHPGNKAMPWFHPITDTWPDRLQRAFN